MKPLAPHLIALTLAAPAWGASDRLDGWVELGAGVTDNGNGRFGEYRQPLQTSGLFGLGGLGLTWRDGDDPYRHGYLAAVASLDQLAFEALHARQGSYRIGFDIRQFEALSRGPVSTLFADRDGVQTLPPGYGGLAGAERFDAHLGVRRERAGLDLMRQLGPWRLAARLSSENKEGGRAVGASERFGDAALLLAPVDQRHDSVDLDAAYLDGPWSLNLRGYHSRFGNDSRALGYANPVNLAAPPRTLDLGPDNGFTRVGFDGAYRFAPTRQVSWFLSRADARQDDDFLQPLLVAGQPLLDSLDAQRVDTDLRLAFHDRPGARFGYRLRWDYRERDNRTNRVQLSPSGYAHLYDSTRERLALDADYRLGGGWRWKGGAELRRVERATRALESFRDDADDRHLWSELRLPALGPLDWSLAVETTERDSDLSTARRAELNPAAPVLATPDYLLAGRNWQYRLTADLTLAEGLLLAAHYRHTRDDFRNDYLGLHGRDSDELSLTLAWQARRDLSVNAWVQHQDFHLSQNGFEFHPTGARSQANARWRQFSDDQSRALGVNLRWQARPGLVASLDLSHGENDSSYRSRWLEAADTGEAGGTSDSLPGVGVDVTRLDASLAWDYSARTRLQLRYLHERLRADDWAWGDDLFNVLAFGWTSPRHDGHALLFTLRHQFAPAP